MIFRRDFVTPEVQPSEAQYKKHILQWQDWLGSLAAQNKLSRPLQRWDSGGRVLKPDHSVTDGPYAEIKESIGGLVIIKADSYDEVVEIARGCPILSVGGTVEIRQGFQALDLV
ncbi:YciI family protein [Pedobacter sp. JY14-1]|uniref:YciI family protein n=1 Tax=Pedobacter sp. JY14-1 TaxID=3034151 RepID=UPI0023E2E077|nr:YciI family protein [Pedobacter sp. JY14-1]